jgi:hypothetical protein
VKATTDSIVPSAFVSTALELQKAHFPPNLPFSIITNRFFSFFYHPLSLSANNITHPPMDAIILS